jgi:hypothetical protein
MDMNEEIKKLVIDALAAQETNTPRTMQSREGRLGPSDIGFCRQKAALMVRGSSQPQM